MCQGRPKEAQGAVQGWTKDGPKAAYERHLRGPMAVQGSLRAAQGGLGTYLEQPSGCLGPIGVRRAAQEWLSLGLGVAQG